MCLSKITVIVYKLLKVCWLEWDNLTIIVLGKWTAHWLGDNWLEWDSLHYLTIVVLGKWTAHWLGDNWSEWDNMHYLIIIVLYRKVDSPLVG